MSAPIPHNKFVLNHVRNLFADWDLPVRESWDDQTSGYTLSIAEDGSNVEVIFFVAMRYANRLGNKLKAELATAWLQVLRNLLDQIETPSYILPARGNGGYFKLHIPADELMRLRVQNLPGDRSAEDAQPAPLMYADQLLDLPAFQLMHNLLGEGKPHVMLNGEFARDWPLQGMRQADRAWIAESKTVIEQVKETDLSFDMRKVRALMKGTRFHTQFMRDALSEPAAPGYMYGYVLLWVGEFRRSKLPIDQDMIGEMQSVALRMFEQTVDYERRGQHELVLHAGRNRFLCEPASAREATA